MRPAGDFRPDCVVKAEILAGIKQDGYEPWLAVDDRSSIIEVWRENGICALQCQAEEIEYPPTAKLTLMVGPSGAGKSTWLKNNSNIYPYYRIISSDQIRAELCVDFRDQSKNDQVFEAVHALAKTRLKHGLETVIDATNIRRADRFACINLVPSYVHVEYIVIDRPMSEKRLDGGWRNALSFDLLEKHQQTFNSNLKDILAGDNVPNVTVRDLRQK